MLTQQQPKTGSRFPWSTMRSWAAYAALPLVGIVTAPILARALGPDGRGQLAAILQPLSVADAFAAIGVPAAMTFFVAQGVRPRRLRRAAASLLAISALLVGVSLFLYSAEIARVANVSRPLLLVLWSSTIIGAFVASRRGVWTGLKRFALLDGERATAATIRVALIVALFLFGSTMSFPFAVAYVGSGLLAALLLFRRFPRLNTRGLSKTNAFSSRLFARYSILASLGAISMTLNNRLDQAVLPAVVSVRDLGYYSVAVTVAEVPVIITTVMNRNLLAEVSSKASKQAIVRTGLTGIVGVALCCGGLAATSPWLVPLAFGSSFASAVPLVWLLLIGTILGSIASAMSVTIAGLGKPGRGSIGPAVGALFTGLLLCIFWKDMTVQLAAVIAIAAQALTATVSGVLLMHIYSRRLK